MFKKLPKSIVRLARLGFYAVKIRVRTTSYSLIFSSFGKKSEIFGKISVTKPEKIKIGNRSTLNEGVFLGGPGGIEIGNYVHISPYVVINSGFLEINGFKEKRHRHKKVVIKDHVWIASGAIINPGVTISKGAIVAAGAVVTKNVPELTVVAGVPARPIKKITSTSPERK